MNTRVPRNLHSHEVVLVLQCREWAYRCNLEEDDEGSSEMGLKIPSKKYIGCIRDSLVGIPVPAVEEDFTEEC